MERLLKPVVLVTGARSPASLEFARAFHVLGAEPHLADCTTARIARWSTAPARVHRYASPVLDPEGFRRDIGRIVAEFGPAVIVPTCEEVFHLAGPGLATSVGGRLFAPPLETLRRLHRKDSFAALAAAIGADAPETHTLATRGDLEPFRGRERLWVFKPCYSRFGSRALVAPESIDAIAFEDGAPWVAQARVIGDEVCFYATARAGAVEAFSAYRADWRMSGGASYSFTPLDDVRATALRAIADCLSEALDFTGQFACDCIIDRDGRCWLLECNPRSTSGVHLCASDAAASALGRPMSDPGRAAPRHNLPMMFSYGLADALRTASLDRWFRSIRDGRDVVGRPGDRGPILGAVVDAAAFKLRARRLGLSLAAATTSDIEWNGAAPP